MVLHSREGASTAQRDIWPFVPPSGGRVTLGPDVGRLGNSNALDLSALCAHSGYGGRQRVAPARKIKMLRIIVRTDMQVQHTMKCWDHPVTAPDAGDDVLKGKLGVLRWSEPGIRRIRIALAGSHPGLHQLVMQKQPPVARVLRLQLELCGPPRRQVIIVRERLSEARDVDMSLPALELCQLIS